MYTIVLRSKNEIPLDYLYTFVIYTLSSQYLRSGPKWFSNVLARQKLCWMIFVRSQLPYQLCPGRWRFFLPPFFIHISQTIRPISFFHRDCEQNFSVSFFPKYYLAKDHIGFKVNTLVKELIVDRMIFFLWIQARNRCTPD